jgi:hypothetical protein
VRDATSGFDLRLLEMRMPIYASRSICIETEQPHGMSSITSLQRSETRRTGASRSELQTFVAVMRISRTRLEGMRALSCPVLLLHRAPSQTSLHRRLGVCSKRRLQFNKRFQLVRLQLLKPLLRGQDVQGA